jgi:hypothetical protein
MQPSGENNRLAANAAFGFRSHSGWAAAVAVAGSLSAPLVIQRWRMDLADRRIPGSLQPFHAAKEMDFEEAALFLRFRAADAKETATAAVRDAVAALALKGYRALGACVLAGSGRIPANLAATLASHPMIHTAEGEFFRDALKQACEASSLAVSSIREKELLQFAAAKLHLTVDDLQRRVSELGKNIGPPWRQDEKLCALAAWTTLAWK